MTQGGGRPLSASRVASIPPSARPSAEHVRALEAAGLLEVRLIKKFAQRPLMSTWQGEDRDKKRILLTVVDACGTPAERVRVLTAARALLPLGGTEGVQNIHRILEDVDAFLSDFLGAGAAADLVVLRWPTMRRLEFACRVCSALVALHSGGIVHGCLCPENILFDDELAPVLTEAGMVSVAESLEGDPENFFGYGAYAAPETTRGAPDKSADIYSVGRLLTFVMLDRAPGASGDFTDLNAMSPAVATIARRCTGPLEQRYPSASELLADLERCRQELVPSAGAAASRSEVEPAPRPAKAPDDKPPLLRQWPADAPAEKWAAPWWVAAVSGTVFALTVVAARAIVFSSQAVGLLLTGLVVAAAVGITTAIRATKGVRIALALVALVAAIALDPVGRGSRLEADDHTERGEAARSLVEAGGKDLRGRRLQNADLSGLDLSEAQLDETDLTGANLTGTKLVFAHVEGATFLLARIGGADLTGVSFTHLNGIQAAICDEATRLPEGWRCDAHHQVSAGPRAP